HEGGFAVHFRGDRLHLLLRQVIRSQHDDRGIAAESLPGERIDMKQPATALSHEEQPRKLGSARWRKPRNRSTGATSTAGRLLPRARSVEFASPWGGPQWA